LIGRLPEPQRMAIFDAVGLAVAAIKSRTS
jgi:hypothetical protein